MIGFIILTVVVLIVIGVTLFLKFSPQFGEGATGAQKAEYAKSGNYENGKFVNQNTTVIGGSYMNMIKELLKGGEDRKPDGNILVEKLDSTAIANRDEAITQLTWFGHSTFLLEMDGKKILIDPMLGEHASPHSTLGPKRYSEELPIEIAKLPFIDAIILSHDHYDHLDYGSIQKLKNKVGQYYMPLGVGNHLLAWGVESERIHELNWWESVYFEGINLVCSPARHFSGRGLFDRATTLWCSWVIAGEKDNIYFSGDSGYDTHFKEIGDRYGPFDISLMECGQYNEEWKVIHMMPEETVQASIDLQSKLVLPIHWGAFTMAYHKWTDPVERITKRANEMNLPVTTPKIGEPVILGKAHYPNEQWWIDYMTRTDK